MIAVPPDQGVDDGVLAEARHARRDDEELAAVGHREPRAVDRLVAEPRRAVLQRIEVGDAAAKRRRERLDVDLGRERGRRAKRRAALGACAAFADEDAAQDRPVVARFDDGEHEQHPATRLEEAIEAPVEQPANGCVDASERLLDPVDGAEEVAALNRLAAAEPDRDVLRVAAEARHLVRHHLPDGDDEVVGTVDQCAVDGELQTEAETDARRPRRPPPREAHRSSSRRRASGAGAATRDRSRRRTSAVTRRGRAAGGCRAPA